MDTPVFDVDDPITKALFSTDSRTAQGNRTKEFREGSIEILKDVWSDSPDLLKFKDLFSRRAQAVTPNVDEFGRVFGNGLRSDFNGIRHINGFPMIPATYPLSDNRLLRERDGFANEFTESWHKAVFKDIVHLFFEDLEPVKMKVRKGSSSCMPFFEKRMGVKLDLARQSHANALRAGALMLKGDYVTPWNDWAIGGAFFTVYRRQSTDQITFDKGRWSSKDRPVADLDFALSGGKTGSFNPARRTFFDGEVDHAPDGFFRERNRTAMGGPWGLNAALTPIAQACRKKIYYDYGYTLHHTTRASIQADLRDWKFNIAADVSNHDWYWPTFFIDSIVETLLDLNYDERWVELFRVCNLLPRFVADVGPGLDNILIGDPRQPDVHGGLTSGNAFTDIFGTIGMVFIYFLIQVEHTYSELIPLLKDDINRRNIIRKYLKGELPIVLKDKSDDALLGWTDNTLVPRAKKLLDKMKADEQVSPYIAVTYEHGGAFLGSILLYPEGGASEGLTLIGNIQSLVNNLFSPEYGVQSAIRDRSKTKRPFPGLAWRSISDVYGTCPLYGDVMDMIEGAWFDVYGESFYARQQRQLAKDEVALAEYISRNAQIGSVILSPIDKEVLDDPSKLEYKFEPSDVSPAVLDFIYQGLDLEEISPYFESVVGL